jgi:hypothetical protein
LIKPEWIQNLGGNDAKGRKKEKKVFYRKKKVVHPEAEKATKKYAGFDGINREKYFREFGRIVTMKGNIPGS